MSQDPDRTKRLEIHVTQRDGSVWAVPLLEVAKHKSVFYADMEPDERGALAWLLAHQDPDDLYEWAVNNMDWQDFNAAGHARRVRGAPPLLAEHFEDAWRLGGDIVDPGVVT